MVPRKLMVKGSSALKKLGVQPAVELEVWKRTASISCQKINCVLLVRCVMMPCQREAGCLEVSRTRTAGACWGLTYC